jgi:iron complex transport system permease protein
VRAVAASTVERPPWPWLSGLWLAALAAFVLYLGVGSADAGEPWKLRVAPGEVLRELLAGDRGPQASAENLIVWQIRLPRALACLLVGAILGLVGSAFQALFRNPLAEPYIVGVSSGAAVGGAAALVLGVAGAFYGLGLMAFAVAAGALSLTLVLALAGRRGATDVQTLLLAGVVVGAMLAAVLALLLFGAGLDANQLLRWLLGSTTPMYWNRIAILAAALAAGLAILLPQAKRLNALAMGEETAQRLGVNAARLKRTLLLTGTGMAAVTVGSVGVIGFLGLVAPHLSRTLLGVDWRWSMLGAGALGAGLLLVSDVLAQRILGGAELPVGVVTAVIGAPFLLALLRRQEA